MGEISKVPPIGGITLLIGCKTGSVMLYINFTKGLNGFGLIQDKKTLITTANIYKFNKKTKVFTFYIIILLNCTHKAPHRQEYTQCK